MAMKEDVVYRKDLSEDELFEAKERTKQTNVKSHADKGAYAGFLLGVVISGIVDTSFFGGVMLVSILTGIGASIGHLEAVYREKKNQN